MKFTEKFEIVEMLTSGRVSTFVARDRANGQRAIVHSFDFPPRRSKDVSIFKYFADLAPTPAGRIIEADFDDASASGYIATSVPADAALQQWIREYRAFGGHLATSSSNAENATAELPASEIRAVLASNRNTSSLPSTFDTQPAPSQSVRPGPLQPRGEFTWSTGDLRASQPPGDISARISPQPKPSGISVPTGQSEISASAYRTENSPWPAEPEGNAPEPGLFTKEFILGGKGGPGSSSLGTSPSVLAEKGPTDPGPFTREFLALASEEKPAADGRGKVPPPSSDSSNSPTALFREILEKPLSGPQSPVGQPQWTMPAPPKSGTGEFTSFFRGPFDPPGPSKTLDTIPNLVDAGPTKQPTGEFTKIFGEDMVDSHPSSAPQLEPEKPASSFTQIFNQGLDIATRLGVSSSLGTNPGGSGKPFTEPLPPSPRNVDPPARESQRSVTPAFESPRAAAPSMGDGTLLHRSSHADATDIFRVRGGEDAPVINEAPSGPSEFTVFLTQSQLNASLPPEPAIGSPSRGTVPKMPAVPGLAVPPPPQFSFSPPALSSVTVPAPASQFAMPAALGAPKPPAPTPRPSSYWPLITVFAILSADGAILVMYFAMKH